jgi:DNA adenine methylase
MRPDSVSADVRPPLKWAGGKRWQLPLLRPIWAAHAHRRLVEPFCGGLGVALGLRPSAALLNDANPHLINFYRWVRRGLTIEIEMANDRQVYLRNRRRFNELVAGRRGATREAASLFYYLNRTGYNGLCRFNSRGLFNVPFGRYTRITYPREFPELRAIFAGWSMSAADVARVRVRPDDFIYADPPYDVPFTQYAKKGFDWADQVRTAELLAEHPGPVVLVNQATERIEALYRRLGFAIRIVSAPRRISNTGDRRPAREVIAVRNLEPG